MITVVIYSPSCKRTYDSNNIPASSTSMEKSDEIYNKASEVKTEATGTMPGDTTANRSQQMEPVNSTGAVHVKEQKK